MESNPAFAAFIPFARVDTIGAQKDEKYEFLTQAAHERRVPTNQLL
jgi:hypothetical protein